jgi:AcrR family transcriptional regulator
MFQTTIGWRSLEEFYYAFGGSVLQGDPDSCRNLIHRRDAVAQKRENTEVRQQQIVGISEAAIYRHFQSKKSILSFLLDHIEEVLLKDISPETVINEPVTLEVIEKIIRKHFSMIGMRKGISFQVIAEIISLGDLTLNKQAYRTIQKYIARLKQLLTDGVRDGAVREDIDLEASATLLFALIQGLVNIWSLSEGRFKLIEKYTALWRIYHHAVARRDSPRQAPESTLP